MTKTVYDYQPCRVPLRRVSFGDAYVVVHEGAVNSIKRIEAKWKARGGNAAYRIRRSDTGAYNCRKTTSGSSWSKHSWGCAVDINWQSNPYGKRLVTDMPRWFVQLWLDEGWGWGGNWKGTKDAMHFSKFPNEGGDGKLYVGGQVVETPKSEEEDEMKFFKKEGSDRVYVLAGSVLFHIGSAAEASRYDPKWREKVRVLKASDKLWSAVTVKE